jgi:two-component system, OmpR family, response regulator MtrA
MATIVDGISNGDLPLLVCVSPDPGVRERVARQLDGGGIVLMCPDVGALRALLAHAGPGAEPVPVPPFQPVSGRNLFIDAADHQVRWRGTPLPLTRLEVELMAQLGREPVRVWPYERLFAAVWGAAYLGDNSILHSAVKRLRRKLRDVGGGLSVETVRGIGYRLVTG